MLSIIRVRRWRAPSVAVACAVVATGGLMWLRTAQSQAAHHARRATGTRHQREDGHGSRGHARGGSDIGSGYLTTWATSPQQPTPVDPTSSTGFNNQTLREIIHPSAGGQKVRLRVSNLYGTQPLVVGSATIAVQLARAAIVPSTLRTLTFGGQHSVTIPAGQEVLSDPLAYAVAPEQNLAISIYLPNATGPTTNHSGALQDNWVSTTGNFASNADASPYRTLVSHWYFADGLLVEGSRHVAGTVVTLGDSITEGDVSQQDANERYSDILGERLQDVAGPTLAVANEGIAGDRLLNDSPCFGQSLINRFQRDVLGQPGVRDVIVLIGVNDIQGHNIDPTSFGPALVPCFPNEIDPTVQQMIDGYKQLIAMAHAHGVRIFGGTITPYDGDPFWDQEGNGKREAINHWILTSGAFDGTVDFAGALADPYDSSYLNPKFTSDSSQTHPNGAGYRAMADAVDLRMLLGRN